MSKILTLLITLLCNSLTFSQTVDALEVETKVKQISENEYDIIFEYFIEEDWHLYSQYNPAEASEALTIRPTNEDEGEFVVVGKAKESQTHTEYSETFEMDETFFKEEAVLTQRVKVKDKELKEVQLTVKGQVCLDSCLPYEEEFTIKLTKKKKKRKKKKKKSDKEEKENKSANGKGDSMKMIVLIAGGLLVIGLILFFLLRKKKTKGEDNE